MQPTERQSSDAVDASRHELIRRVAESAPLSKAPRLRELFLYLCDRTLDGRDEDLREPAIGTDVFGRPAGYDTGSDNIVRVSVFQLRKKLEQYFQHEGADETVVISIPKGRYLVEFREQSTVATAAEPPPPPVAVSEGPIAGPPRRARRLAWLPVACAAVLILAALFWLMPRESRLVRDHSEHEQFWRSIFPADRETYVVVADSGFALLQDVTGEPLTLERYLKGIAPNGASRAANHPPELVQRLVGRQYTSVADAAIAFRLGALNHIVGGRAVIRAARSINVRDLKTHNTVLLGSARSNPWVELLRDRLNFRLQYEEQPPRGWIENRHPRPGEPQIFRATATGSRSGEAFGLLSYVPNPDGTGVIVSISGTNMEGTEAAAELLLNSVRFRTLLTRLGDDPSEPLSPFEAVIRATSFGGAASSPEIVTLRRVGN